MAGGYGGTPNLGSITGAASFLGKAANPIGMGLSLLPAAFKMISGFSQKHQANKINPTNPGYSVNGGVIDNQGLLQNKYSNYQMPGYSQQLNQIGSNTAAAFDNGTMGASSSGDVLDLATKLAYGQNRSISSLNTQNAQGKEAAFGNMLQGNAAAGAEYQAKNAYDREQYDRQLREKAALIESANKNIYGGLDQVGSVAGAALNPKKTVNPYTGQTGTANPLGSIYPTPTS